MQITVLGGAGGYPTEHQGCSGFLLEHDGFRLVVDPGYATIQPLLKLVAPADVDAVWVSHGHPDHCADLHPLLRARALAATPPSPLPVYAPAGALGPLLNLDQPGIVDHAYELHTVADGDTFGVGPLRFIARELPHMVPNLGVRIYVRDSALVYTGDSGPSPSIADLAAAVNLLIANATHVEEVPAARAAFLSSALQAGSDARDAGAKALLLTHLWPGVDPDAAVAAAHQAYDGPVQAAAPGLVLTV